ncbi:helix-turn-helix domain-containing protein [Streptomyces narbonensis]|uniref:helix-turn-helix domain-containing protein n=1 Tax=Streptomyces narbonensis TaxID=67333 RepID=UPI003F4D271B
MGPQDRVPASSARADRAARGLSNARIAERVGVHVDTVRTWRNRFAELGMPGLADRKRAGRPPFFTPLQAAQVKALACQLPAETGTPLSAGAPPNWPARPSSAASRPSCRPPPCAAGSRRTPSSPGNTIPGSSSPTPTSAPRPRASWIYTPAPGTASRSARTNSSQRRREDLDPGPLSLPPHPRARQGPRDAREPHLRPRWRTERTTKGGAEPCRRGDRRRPRVPWPARIRRCPAGA